MFKGLGQFASLLRQAKTMRGQMGDIEQKLSAIRGRGESGAGLVVVEANGLQKITSVRIDPSLVEDPDLSLLEDLVAAAVNAALEKSQAAVAEEMSNLSGGLDLSALQGLFGGGGFPSTDSDGPDTEPPAGGTDGKV